LKRALGIFIDVPDNATVSGNWTMIIDGKVVNSTVVPAIPSYPVPPNVIVERSADGTTKFSCSNDVNGTAVLSVWGRDGAVEHYNKVYEPHCFMGDNRPDIISRRCKDYTLFYNKAPAPQTVLSDDSYWLNGDLLRMPLYVRIYGIKPLHRRLFVELPSFVEPVELLYEPARYTIQFSDSFVKRYYQTIGEYLTAYKTIRAKSVDNGTMECAGGEIVYVSNDFCEEESVESIKELRAQYAKASNLTAYRQTTSVKARCQYKVRTASSRKTLVGFVCALPKYYCFQTPLMEKREVKFIRPLQKPNIAWSYYSLNDDMCAPGVIENIDVSKGGQAPLYLPNNPQRNNNYLIIHKVRY
jgi:hypothetical protein